MEADIETIHFSPLSREEFALALRYGRGNALRHVLHFGLAGVDDLVLNACLLDYSYEWECMNDRAVWLYKMFKDTPEAVRFSNRILAALRSADDEQYPLGHLCDLASLMARDGNTFAAQTLHDFFWQQDFQEWGGDVYGSKAIIASEGFDAVRDLARRYGEMILADYDDCLTGLYYQFYEAAEFEAMFERLKSVAANDPAIAAFVELEEKDRQRRIREEGRSKQDKAFLHAYHALEMQKIIPLHILFATAEQHLNNVYHFSYFGYYAKPEQLKAVLERFVKEKDVEVCLRLLWVFYSTSPPFLPFKLWAYAQHADKRLRYAALMALSHYAQSDVAEFARQRVQLAALNLGDAKVLELFKHHYQAGDEDLIMNGLLALEIKDEHEMHTLCVGIVALCEHQMNPAFSKLLIWLYQHSPCMVCRRDALKILRQLNLVPPEIAEEFQYDASRYILVKFGASGYEYDDQAAIV